MSPETAPAKPPGRLQVGRDAAVAPPDLPYAAAEPARPTSMNTRPSRSASRPGAVRIIGGSLRRSRLPVPDAPGLRPTPDRVRETLFNWLGQDLSGLRCLDLFAGSGALGLEAASRGAAAVDLVERDARLARELEATRARLGTGNARVHADDALRFAAHCAAGSYDIVFVDPPYAMAAEGLHARALAAAARLLRPGGMAYIEAPDPALLAAWADPALWHVHRQDRAAQVHYAVLQRNNPVQAG